MNAKKNYLENSHQPLEEKTSRNIAVVGIGNSIRSDDGIGAYICSCVDSWNLPGVTTITVQQLHTTLIEDLLLFDGIVLADASIAGGPVAFYPLEEDDSGILSSSHHINAGLLAALTRQLYNKKLPVMICAVRGENFAIGDKLSAGGLQNATKALALIRNWVSAGVY